MTSPVSSTRDRFVLLVWLYRYAYYRQRYTHQFSDSFCNTLAQFLVQFEDSLDDYGIRLQDQPGLAQQGTIELPGTAFCIVAPPIKSLGVIVENIGQLTCGQRLLAAPVRYYLLAEDWCSETDDYSTAPETIKAYQSILALLGVFTEKADLTEPEKLRLHFLGQQHYILQVAYGPSELTMEVHQHASQLMTRFSDTVHRQQKLDMLLNELFSAREGETCQRDLHSLISRLPELTQKLDQSYRLFCADFSFDHIREKEQDLRLEQLARIHKTFSDIQSQILSIPLSFLIVSSAIRPVTRANPEQATINLTVVAGTLGYVLLMTFALRNQWHTLAVIRQDLDRKRHQLETNYAQIFDLVGSIFPGLYQRLAAQKLAVAAVGLVLAVLLAGTVVLYARQGSPW